MCRSVFQQGDSWRAIDNCKIKHNATVSASERSHTTSVDLHMALLQRMRALFGCPLSGATQPVVAIRGMKRAYRQLPVCPDHLR